MKQTLAPIPNRPISSATLALGLSLGLALAACRLAAADATNAAVAAPRTPPPTKLVIPPEWKVAAEARDYDFDNLPLTEVIRNLQEQAKQQFDVLTPGSVFLHWPLPGGIEEGIDTGNIPIRLRLRNVSVIEVFQAMNMLFEIENTSLRWELAMNGHRPVALLRQLELEPPPPVPGGGMPVEARSQTVDHCVVYVGNLLGTPDTGRVSPDALGEILEQTAQKTFPDSSTRKIQFHRGAELVVLSGTGEELRFMNDVLRALKEKADDRRKGGSPGDQETPAKK